MGKEQSLIGEGTRTLTEKQRAVMEGIDRRQPIKLIAGELGVSETRINQHIRALKAIYGASSLNELVEEFRKAEPQQPENPEPTGEVPPFRNVAYSNKQLPEQDIMAQQSTRDDPGSIRVSDAHVVARDALWAHDIEPVVVFGALDGDNAVLYRLAVMVGLAFGMIAAVVLVVSAALSLSEVLDGKASVPVDSQGAAG